MISPARLALLSDWLTANAEGEPVRATVDFEWSEETAKGRSGPMAGWQAEVEVKGENFGWRNLQVTSFTGGAALADGVVKFSKVGLRETDAALRASGRYDTSTGTLTLTEYSDVLEPARLRKWLGLGDDTERRLSFLSPMSVSGKGLTIEMADLSRSHGSVFLSVPGGVSLPTAGGNPVRIDEVAGTVILNDRILYTKGAGARVLGGRATVDYRTDLFEKAKPWYECALTVSDASLAALAELVEPKAKEKPNGKFGFTLSGRVVDNVESFAGGGNVKLRTDEEVDYFPVVDDLLEFIEVIVPWFGRNPNWVMDMPFTVERGILSTDNMTLQSSAARIDVKGRADLFKNRVSLEARAELRGLIGITTGWLTRLFVVEGNGTLTDIEFSYKNLTPPGGKKPRSLIRPGMRRRR